MLTQTLSLKYQFSFSLCWKHLCLFGPCDIGYMCNDGMHTEWFHGIRCIQDRSVLKKKMKNMFFYFLSFKNINKVRITSNYRISTMVPITKKKTFFFLSIYITKTSQRKEYLEYYTNTQDLGVVYHKYSTKSPVHPDHREG